jgi:undecaprenyl-diphosphatase
MSPLLLLLVLAAIQGLAEFLPISSSGHLVLAGKLLPGGEQLPNGIGVEIMLHLGTLFAVLIFYRARIGRLITGLFSASSEGSLQRDYLFKLIVATVPAVLAGLYLFDTDSAFFQSVDLVAVGLVFTALVLLSSQLIKEPSTEPSIDAPEPSISFGRALLIGIAQAVAILPGISRSGSTIVMARHLKINAQQAEDFSFLMSIPTIIGAAILKSPQLDLEKGLGLSAIEVCASLLLSCIVGLIALHLLHGVIQKRKLHVFAPYCLAVAAAVLLLD